MYNYYDNMIEDDIFYNNKEVRGSGKSVEQITNEMIKLFIKENKKTTLKDLTVGYVAFHKDINNAVELRVAISILKDKFNAFMIDIYHDYKQINRDMSEGQYVRYANNKFNVILKERYLVVAD